MLAVLLAGISSSDMFMCKICTAAFTCRSSLSRHVNTHKENNIVCVLCDGAFTRRDSLNAHIKTIHKGHLTDNRDAFTRASNDYYDETSKQPADKEDVLEERCAYMRMTTKIPIHLWMIYVIILWSVA
ncbi:hypothetical protein NQ318_014634 [Aromia moschata]|uniref:C2H2-type domain-containing protein n=1 Tax=Aromia moschata TaxID=1265417 RepID=A0AAV8ZCU8_9CUCU|nr:hypothetical protein NQ318_014634 [Aromia moschata]